MFFRIVEKRIQAHPKDEHENVAKQNRERMPHEQVTNSLPLRRLQKLRLRHDRKRTDVRPAQLGIVVMMMIVRTAPDAARAKSVNSKHPHQPLGQPGMRENGVMLLIVINHEQSQDQKS